MTEAGATETEGGVAAAMVGEEGTTEEEAAVSLHVFDLQDTCLRVGTAAPALFAQGRSLIQRAKIRCT